MILATLLLCGRDNAILSFLGPEESQACDNILPLRFGSDERSDSDDSPGQSDSDDSPGQSDSAESSEQSGSGDSPKQCDYGLTTDEQELFAYFQWLVYTPFLPCLTSGNWEDVITFPEEVSLPWLKNKRMRKKQAGEVSYVEEIEIYRSNHDLVSNAVEYNCMKTLRSN